MTQRGTVINVQRFTIHDGPGLRTELFLKGCPLRCKWCGNPETFKTRIEPGVYQSKCISYEKCGSCATVCKQGALNFVGDKLSFIDRSKCVNCMSCVEECPSEAIKQWGKIMSIDECMTIIRKDMGYYERSGGGVTVSGGEALLQSDFVADLFKTCQAENIHTCCESCFHVNWSEIEKVLPYTDLFISDIKHMDPLVHKEYTGASNKKVLDNLKKFSKTDKEIILRIPVIPNVNDGMDNMKATADFILQEMGGRVRTLQLLSFMRLGEEKYKSLGMPYPMEGIEVDREAFQEKIEKYAEYFNSRGIHCLVGTKEKV